MPGNSFGKIWKLTTFGESHGKAIGCILDGVPAGLDIDIALIQKELDRRKPGQSKIVTQRKEGDDVEILSGLFEGKTTGTPISMVIRNKDAKSKDYSHIAAKYRPSHADYTYEQKYGHRDYRGGGRSSARETAARVAAGAIAKIFLVQQGITIHSWVHSVGEMKLLLNKSKLDLSLIDSNSVRCPDPQTAVAMENLILRTKKNGDTIGGVISGQISGLPVGLGEPVFDKLHAVLGQAMLSINACKGFEYGSGFEGTSMLGSQHNDEFFSNENGETKTKTNHSGGIQGGISNGMNIDFKVAFKPVATIIKDQESIDQEGNKTIVSGKGRHDPCVLPRAVPIVDAMAALVIADFILRKRMDKI